ncbi:TPA: hypothetical protein MDE87_001781 [Klebsiella pneumoniae]|nr:hypothetical protein [Klebsiella pneumoniae]HBU8750157.1 hypothetical protein [Klebsiella pneumoniae]HBW4998637.1 hypothetical protein [Klebsiella pneumoniae]HBW5335212.1 hypothetical protein [Klebsiella pneumoniae]HBW5633236.1 hypothetical protein [Klebsiella pneumoniae]
MNKPFYPEADRDGVITGSGLVGFLSVTESLCRGDYDHNLDEGMGLACAVLDGVALTWFAAAPEQHASLWRWIVAAAFIAEQVKNNGNINVIGENGSNVKVAVYAGKPGAMTVYPVAERIALASHVEGYSLQKYGPATGMDLSIQYYQTMVEWRDGTYRLSDHGRDVLADLHDNLLATISAFGVPSMPTEH